MLFCADTRGDDRTRRLPDVSAAVSAKSRLNAPLIDPSARPTALLGAGAGRLTAVDVSGPPAGPWTPRRPPICPLFGNARLVEVPSAGSTRPLKPHWIPSWRA